MKDNDDLAWLTFLFIGYAFIILMWLIDKG
jgi:hypothetical protein